MHPVEIFMVAAILCFGVNEELRQNVATGSGVTARDDWENAFATCGNVSRNLLTPSTALEYKKIKEYMEVQNITFLWTGMKVQMYSQPTWSDYTILERGMNIHNDCGILDIIRSKMGSDICENTKDGYFCSFASEEGCQDRCKSVGKTCSSKEINSQCIIGVCDAVDWLTAWTNCDKLGGRLATAKTKPFRYTLYQSASHLQKYCRKLWIGLSKKKIVYFESRGNEAISIFPQYSAWPQNSWRYENSCLAIHKSRKDLFALPCLQKLSYVCTTDIESLSNEPAPINQERSTLRQYSEEKTINGKNTNLIVAVILPTVVVAAIFIMILTILRKRKVFKRHQKSELEAKYNIIRDIPQTNIDCKLEDTPSDLSEVFRLIEDSEKKEYWKNKVDDSQNKKLTKSDYEDSILARQLPIAQCIEVFYPISLNEDEVRVGDTTACSKKPLSNRLKSEEQIPNKMQNSGIAATFFTSKRENRGLTKNRRPRIMSAPP